ncbi:MAG: hypothetical protein ACO1OJ_04175 [Brevundimonas sp.]
MRTRPRPAAEEAEEALFTLEEMKRARALGRSWLLGLGYRPSDYLSPTEARGEYERAVVAVDPPVGTLSGEGGDACGIVVVAGRRGRPGCWTTARCGG